MQLYSPICHTPVLEKGAGKGFVPSCASVILKEFRSYLKTFPAFSSTCKAVEGEKEKSILGSNPWG